MTAVPAHARAKGRIELLRWINKLLATEYQQVQDLADGLAYTQVFDALYPGKVPLHRLEWAPRYEEDYIRNLRILDKFLADVPGSIVVPVEKLAKAKLQDNLEFLQWVYHFVTSRDPNLSRWYQGYARRLEAQGKKALEVPMESYHEASRASSKGYVSEREEHAGSEAPEDTRVREIYDVIDGLSMELRNRFSVLEQLKESNHNILEERDFYFKKLRLVEDVARAFGHTREAQQVLDVLRVSNRAFEPAQ